MIRKKELYRDERFWTLMIAFLVFLTCLWLTYTERFIKEEYSYTEDELQTIHLSNGEALYQEVSLNGKIKTMKLGIETISEQKESALNIHLVQGGGYNENQRINYSGGSQKKIWIPIDTTNLKPGKFEVFISAADENEHNLLVSKDFFGKSELRKDGYTQKVDNLALQLSVTITPIHTKGRVIFLLMFIVLLFLLAITLYGSLKKEKTLFWISFGMILIHFLIRYPRFSWQAEPFWETSSNLLWQTYTRGYLKSILLDDAGYWCFFPRILTILVLALFGIQIAPVILQMFCAILFSYVCAKFVRENYKDYYSSEIRFSISLFMGCTLYFSINSIAPLHNIGYIGGIYIVLTFMQNTDNINKKKLFFTCVLSTLFCMSKFHFVVLLPILVIIMLNFKNLTNYMKYYVISCFVGPVLMLTYHILGIAEMRRGISYKNLSTLCLTTWYYIQQAILYLLKDYNEKGYWGGGIYNSIILIFLLISFITVIKSSGKKRWLCLGLAAWTGGILIVNICSGRVSKMINHLTDFGIATSYTTGRNEFLVAVGILFLFIIFFSDNYIFKQHSHNRNLIRLMLILSLVFRFSLKPGSETITYYDSNWHIFSQYLTNDSYAIPAGTNDAFFLIKNADITYYGNKKISTINGHFASGVSYIKAIENSINSIDKIELDGKTLVSIYAKKYKLSIPNNVVMIVFDKNNNILDIVPGINRKDRAIIGFIPQKPLTGAVKCIFVNSETNAPYFLMPHIFVTTENIDRGIAGDASWGKTSLQE